MSLTIADFNEPTEHPYQMLEAYQNASQKESVLAYILSECIKEGDIAAPVQTVYSHPTMVSDGLLGQSGERTYYLCLLYTSDAADE